MIRSVIPDIATVNEYIGCVVAVPEKNATASHFDGAIVTYLVTVIYIKLIS